MGLRETGARRTSSGGAVEVEEDGKVARRFTRGVDSTASCRAQTPPLRLDAPSIYHPVRWCALARPSAEVVSTVRGMLTTGPCAELPVCTMQARTAAQKRIEKENAMMATRLAALRNESPSTFHSQAPAPSMSHSKVRHCP